MSIVTRFLFVFLLCLNFFSCARREQALYQRSPREQFTKATSQPIASPELKLSSPDTSQSVSLSQPVIISASASSNVPVEKTKPVWRNQSVPTLTSAKPVVDQAQNHQTKAQLRKAILKKLVADTPVKTSGLAVAALVCGILAFFVLAVLLGPLAIIFGGVALSKIRKNPDLKGRGLAVAGLVLGIVATVVIIAVLASR